MEKKFLKDSLGELQEIRPIELPVGDLGVEVIEAILVDAITLGEVIAEAIKGKDITQLLLMAAGLAAKYKNFGEVFGRAIAEFKDLQEAEAAQVIQTVKDEFDLENDALEQAIERLLDLPLVGYRETIDTFEQIRKVAMILKDKNATLGQKLRLLAENMDDLVDQGADIVGFIGLFLDTFKELFGLWSKEQDKAPA